MGAIYCDLRNRCKNNEEKVERDFVYDILYSVFDEHKILEI